jgi:hypothetical protein
MDLYMVWNFQFEATSPTLVYKNLGFYWDFHAHMTYNNKQNRKVTQSDQFVRKTRGRHHGPIDKGFVWNDAKNGRAPHLAGIINIYIQGCLK